MHANTWPHQCHQVMNHRVYKIALVVIWALWAAMTTGTMLYLVSGLLEKTLFSNLLFPVVITAANFKTFARGFEYQFDEENSAKLVPQPDRIKL